MTRLSRLMGVPDTASRYGGSLDGHRDRLGLDPDCDRVALLRRHWRRLSPAGLLEVAERSHDTDELGVWLELSLVRPHLARSQVELLPAHQGRSQRLGLLLEQGEEVRSVEGPYTLQFVDAHHNRRWTASGIGVGLRGCLDGALQERRGGTP